MTPMNILEIAIRPTSLCMRLFGNVLGAFVIMELLKLVVPVFVPAVFSLYFDLFDGLIQTYVFVFLTALFMKESIGDLIVTATSMHSRNNRAGILIGKGESPEQAVKEVGMVVEGINALPAAMELAEKYHVEMPIAQTVNAIVKEGMSASDALRNLMSRDRKSEMPQGYESV